MPRAIILVMDSLGIGAAPDAAEYGDTGANTLGHIAARCAAGASDERRADGPLRIPNLVGLGLGEAARLVSDDFPPGLECDAPTGLYGACAEKSRGKDTPSGHWEIAGLPVEFDWGFFPHEFPSFPAALTEALIREADLPGLLGNLHASGTEIIAELGDEHVKTGKPIVYTSGDSVFQIAAHEESFGLERLYEICLIARRLVDEYEIGRVIARPFTGESGQYQRTRNRRDYATPPHGPTLLDILKGAGREVISIGKIRDIFTGRGITKICQAYGTGGLFDATLDEVKSAPDGSLIFTNFVDFDTLYGHRRDVAGYASELEYFDSRLPELLPLLKSDDLVVLTADHGCDPTWPGSDHTREYIPFVAYGPGVQGRSIGLRDSFADIGASLAEHLGVPPTGAGVSAL
jgi:phosphopentomutase